ncbi:hypothetical protein [Streptomyces sp. S.PB5]|uniref:hypothetical protein n=1 Tax=Streptomyces sp. S.PB5 TaxID=3020844 RepID=UPI0025AF32CB|nr:hypothetical protein [Streptomyces sp. S.PB5]MDN3025502.1 hypothetical protein [Streptomyces sp. S.PB5]
MEFNEALRRTVGGHWRLLVLFIVLPMLVVGVLELRDARAYVSKARVQASATLPATDVQANAMLSRVKAVATSSSVVSTALEESKVTDRTPAQVAKETRVSRLGGSSVFTVKVTDADPRTAEKLAGALSEELVTFFNGTGNLLVTQLTDREAALHDERVRVAGELPGAKDAAESGRLTAELSSLDQQIQDVQASLRAAEAAGLGDRTASLLSPASDAVPVPPLSRTDMALAGMGGLVAGLLAVTLLEVFRPHVAGPSAFARELDAPVLGRLRTTERRGRKAGPGAPACLHTETVVALRRAVARTRAGTVVLTGPAGEERLGTLAKELEARLDLSVVPGSGPDPELRAGHLGGPHAAGTVPDGNDGQEHYGLIRTLTTSRIREATALTDGRAVPRPATAVRVRALHQVDDVSDTARHVLLVVEPEFPPYAELRRVRNLVAATGWQVIGVLGDHSTRRSRKAARSERG